MAITRLKTTLLILVCSLYLSTAAADTFDTAALMNLLSTAPDTEVAYTEKKYSTLLTEPLTSSGTLSYRRPDTIEKTILTPRKEQYRIIGRDLIITRPDSEKRYPLASQPLLAALAASLRGVLTGNLNLLNQYYRSAVEGDSQAWRLELIPLNKETRRYLQQITIIGQTQHITQINIQETSGDRSTMQIRSQHP